MCLFTHFAAGALAGGATGNIWAGAVAGVVSHAVLDVIPHYDHPDWRIELGGGILALLILLLMPFSSAAAVVGGLFGMAPDLENLFQKLGRMKRSSFIFPTHTGLLRHGRELGPRSLVWQVVIFIGCFLALGLIQPGEAAAAEFSGQAEMGRPVVRLVSQGQDRSVVRVTFPVDEHPADWRTLSLDQVTWGLPLEVDPAKTEGPAVHPPHVPVTLAVPTRRPVRTRVVEVLWWREPDTTPDLAAETAFADPALYRTVPLTGAAVPVSAAGGVLREITLEILHPADGDPRRQLALAGTADEFDSRDRVRVPDAVLNGDLYRALATGGLAAAETPVPRAKAAEFDPFALTNHWVKLEVMATGVFRFTGQDLLNYGVATGDVDPAKLRIYRGGGLHLAADPEVPDTLQFDRAFLNEIAIEVVGGDDGEWNLDDEVRFYGFGSSAWLDRFDPAGPLDEFYDHPYSDRAIYWVTWETDATPSPLPGSPLRIPVSAAPSLGGAVVDFARSREHVEVQAFDEAGLVEDNWTWDNAVIGSLPAQTFQLRQVVPDSAADFSMDVRGKWYSLFDRHSFRMTGWLNDDEANAGVVDFDRSTQEISRRVKIEGRSSRLNVEGTLNTFKVRNESGTGVPASFDCFDIYYWALLDIRDGSALEFVHPADQVPAPGSAMDFRVTAQGGEIPVLWDVTDPAAAAVFTGQDLGADVHAFGLVRDQDARHFVAVGEGDYLRPASGRRVRPVSLRGPVPDVDYIVVHAPLFSVPAAELAQYRSMDLPGVSNPAALAVSAGDIYDNFSGGQKDPHAIRNFLRRVYDEGGMRLRYACLLGNASRDYRNYKGKNPNLDLYDHLPTVLRTDFPITPVPLTSRLAYSSDDGLSSFDTAPVNDLDFPDIGTGRLPASNLTEAQDLVDRAIAYASDPDPGTWRNEVIFVADDCVTFSSWPTPIQGEQAHTLHAEDLAGLYLPQALDLQKIYGVAYEFPPSSRVKPSMRSDINEALGRGATMFYYVGHGAEDNLADEQVFQSTDIPSLGNGMKRPLFNAFSCDVGVFDSPSHHSMAEKFILEDEGGAIGSICASQVSFAHSNRLLANAFYGSLFPGRRVDPGMSVSEALAMGKSLMGSRDYRKNSQRYNLLSDPALKLPHPVDDLSFAEASDDTMYAGNLMTARVEAAGRKAMLTPGDSYELLAEESGYDFGYIYAYRDSATGDPQNPFIDVPRWDTFPHRGGNVFLGNGVVEAGDLTIPFMVPAQLRYGDRARLRLISSGLEGENSAFMPLPAVRAEIGANDDVFGPKIDLAFENNSFTVRPGTPLNAALDDTSGIAILGTAPGNSLLLEFDETGFMIDVTSSFVFDQNSYQQGRLSIPLPGDLELGKHTAALHGADALGNVGSDTLSFEVAPAGVSGIERITLFPNPTPGPCRLIFELSDPMEVQWEIYTTSGRRLKTVRRNFAQAGPRILEWDGRDDAGDEIANGTYIFVLRGLGGAEDGREITSTGKLVIMR